MELHPQGSTITLRLRELRYMSEALTILIRRPKKKPTKLTVQVNSANLHKLRKKYGINFSFVLEQIMDHIEQYGLGDDKILTLKFAKPGDSK